MKLEDKFTKEEAKILRSRMENKIINAMHRGIEYTLTEEDWCMFGDKLLGKGTCDYTGLDFHRSPSNGRYPSIERIDQQKGYIRGNIAIVGVRVNELKDFLIDKTESHLDTLPVTRHDGKLLKPLFYKATKGNLKIIAEKYIPGLEEAKKLKQAADEIKAIEIPVIETKKGEEPVANMIEEVKPVICDKLVSLEVTANPTPTIRELPSDVEVATNYAAFCKMMSRCGCDVTLTYNQFKAVFITKTCNFSRETLTKDNKFFILLDRTKPVEKGNIGVTTEAVGCAMNKLLDVTGGSIYDLAANLKKFL